MKHFRHFQQFLLLAIVVIASGLIPTASAQSNVAEIFIREIDASGFPEIALSLRAVDASNGALLTLTDSAIAVFEEGRAIEEVNIVPIEPVAINTIFVLDLGQYSSFANLGTNVSRQALLQFVRGEYFRDGIDTVAVLGRIEDDEGDRTVTLLSATQSAAAFTAWANAFDFATQGDPVGLLGVESAVGELSNLVEEVGTEGASVVYVGGIIHKILQSQALRDARSLAQSAKAQNIRIYALDTRNAYVGDDLSAPIRALAEVSGARYVQLRPDRDNTTNLNSIYQDVIDQGAAYQITYRSPRGEPGVRSVSVLPSGTRPDSDTTATSYSVSQRSVNVSVTRPSDGTAINRKVSVNQTGDTWEYEVKTVDVAAELTVPDQRTIQRAELVIDNVSVATIQPDAAARRVQFVWDISDITSNVTRAVQVRVTDEFGMEWVSGTSSVSIGAEPPPTLVPTVVITKEVEVLVGTPDPCELDPTSPQCITKRTINIAPWVGFGVTSILAVVLFVNRKKVVAAGGRVINAASEVRKTLLGGSGRSGQKPIAKMVVITARRDLVGQEINVHTYTTTFGRDPKLCDIQLYDEDDRSTVSGQHCTLQYDKSRDTFVLTDDNSTSGTTVNGRAIRPNDPTELREGDEIVLGDLFRRGAKLRFQRIHAEHDEPLGNVTELGDVEDVFGTIFEDEQSIFDESPSLSDETILDMKDSGEIPFQKGDSNRKNKPESNDWLNDLE